jgi:hypothetical protein
MRIRPRFSLAALFLFLTVGGVFCTYFMLGDLGFKFNETTNGLCDNKTIGLLKYSYGLDTLCLRKGRLEYVIIIIGAKTQSIALRTYTSKEATTHTVLIDEEPFDVPLGVQLVQVESGYLKTFQEEVTLEQWLTFLDVQKGIPRIEDLLEFCSRNETNQH